MIGLDNLTALAAFCNTLFYYFEIEKRQPIFGDQAAGRARDMLRFRTAGSRTNCGFPQRQNQWPAPPPDVITWGPTD